MTMLRRAPIAMWLFPAQWFFPALCGVFMLYRFNWSRWMLVAWVGYHSYQTLMIFLRQA